jgi:hypothetical protein
MERVDAMKEKKLDLGDDWEKNTSWDDEPVSATAKLTGYTETVPMSVLGVYRQAKHVGGGVTLWCSTLLFEARYDHYTGSLRVYEVHLYAFYQNNYVHYKRMILDATGMTIAEIQERAAKLFYDFVDNWETVELTP